MSDASIATAPADAGPPAWADLLRDGRGLYTLLVLLGTMVYALQILIMAIIMPAIVGDIGGAAYYAWPTMLYTIGTIVGAASLGPVWAALGRRRGLIASVVALAIGTAGCAVAPDMATLIVARAFQGIAGGLVIGGCMALVSALFDERLRTRILAAYQGVWMVSQLFGPAVGGAFAEIGWWRGSFWTMIPFMLVFIAIAWFKLPDGEARKTESAGGFPVLRLGVLCSGLFCIAAAGPIEGTAARVALIAAAIALIWLTFRLDRVAENRLYPTAALSVYSPVGLALWILFIVGMVQTSVTLFLPLLLQVVHGVTPLFISFVTVVISIGWTTGTFTVSGWTGAKERLALWIGPLFMIAGLAGITTTAQLPLLAVLTVAAFFLGLGIGTHNVHLVARTMAAAREGEDRVTASAMPSIRSLGTAFGAATAGMLSTIAGLGDATEPAAVGNAVTAVYGFSLLPLFCAAIFMVMLVRHGSRSKPLAAGA